MSNNQSSTSNRPRYCPNCNKPTRISTQGGLICYCPYCGWGMKKIKDINKSLSEAKDPPLPLPIFILNIFLIPLIIFGPYIAIIHFIHPKQPTFSFIYWGVIFALTAIGFIYSPTNMDADTAENYAWCGKDAIGLIILLCLGRSIACTVRSAYIYLFRK